MTKQFLCAVLFFAAAGCTPKMESLHSYNVDETFADLSVTDLETEYFSAHSLQCLVKAPVADDYETVEQPYMEFPKGVLVVFYDGELNAKSRMKADYAVYYSKKKLWEARRNVVIVSENGTELHTEQLFGDENSKKIFSVKKATVIDPDSTVIVGKQGFESDMAFKNYKFLDVNGQVSLKESYGADLPQEEETN